MVCAHAHEPVRATASSSPCLQALRYASDALAKGDAAWAIQVLERGLVHAPTEPNMLTMLAKVPPPRPPPTSALALRPAALGGVGSGRLRGLPTPFTAGASRFRLSAIPGSVPVRSGNGLKGSPCVLVFVFFLFLVLNPLPGPCFILQAEKQSLAERTFAAEEKVLICEEQSRELQARLERSQQVTPRAEALCVDALRRAEEAQGPGPRTRGAVSESSNVYIVPIQAGRTNTVFCGGHRKSAFVLLGVLL